MASITDIINASKPRQHTISICIRGDLVDEKHKLERELEQVRREDNLRNRKPQAPVIARKIEKLQKEAEEYTHEFVFQSIGQRAWNRLIAKYPPTVEQKKMAKQSGERLDFDVEKFPVAAIAASVVSPEMNEEDASNLYDAWNFAQWNALWAACLEANLGDTSVGKSSAASLILRSTSERSRQASSSESPTASSLAESN